MDQCKFCQRELYFDDELTEQICHKCKRKKQMVVE